MEFETRAIHDGQEPDPATGAMITPIYQTATFVQEAVGVNKGYDYSRVANPTRTALQVALASLENAEHGVAFSSGLGATTTLMHLVNPGERVVLIADVYGGVYRMTSQVYEPKGYLFDYVPAAEFANLADRLDENTRMVWVETPSNPMLNLVDIRRAADAAHAVGAILVVDNTFATPYLQNPLDLGADIVAPLDDEVPRRPLRRHRRLLRHERPDDRRAPLLPAEVARRRARPVRLLARAARDQDARRADAAPLRERTRDRRLAREPARNRARALSRAPGASGARDREAADARLRRHDLRSWPGPRTRPSSSSADEALQLAESLGGVESLIEHPARMTHASTADAPFAAPRNLVRLSVGIEAVDDLIADLAAALVPAAAHAK